MIVEQPRQYHLWSLICAGAIFGSTAVVLAGVLVGIYALGLCPKHPDSRIANSRVVGRLLPWDGVWYRRVVEEGYHYDPDRNSSVAFFPLYPLFGRVGRFVAGGDTAWGLFLANLTAYVGVMWIFIKYLRERFPSKPRIVVMSVLAIAVFPTTLYFHMSYTESTFLLFCLFSMLAMQQRWPAGMVALSIGATTAARSVGVALGLPFLVYLWTTSSSKSNFLARGMLWGPIACWGLLSYMAYQWKTFDEPLAFVKTQKHWVEYHPPEHPMDYAAALATFEPFRLPYDSDCPCYWKHDPPQGNVLFNMTFLGPLYVAFGWIVVGIGTWKKILTREEILLAVGLFAIPYVLHSYRACMASEARYASVVFPMYLVLGHGLTKLPNWVCACLASVSAFFLAAYSALFVAWYWFY